LHAAALRHARERGDADPQERNKTNLAGAGLDPPCVVLLPATRSHQQQPKPCRAPRLLACAPRKQQLKSAGAPLAEGPQPTQAHHRFRGSHCLLLRGAAPPPPAYPRRPATDFAPRPKPPRVLARAGLHEKMSCGGASRHQHWRPLGPRRFPPRLAPAAAQRRHVRSVQHPAAG